MKEKMMELMLKQRLKLKDRLRQKLKRLKDREGKRLRGEKLSRRKKR